MLRSTFATLKNRFATLKQRFVAFDERLDAWADRHWPALSTIGYALSFVLLFGGVALHAYGSGLAHAAAVRCGSVCSATRGYGFMAAAICGGAAILFVKLYAGLTSAVRRRFFDPFKFVRPEPPTKQVARWAAVLHCLIGIALFIAMAGLAKVPISGRLFETTLEIPKWRFEATLGDHGFLEMALGWWVGGLSVLRFFWPTYPRGGSFTRDHAAGARRT
jgi:hypothetical protein